MTDILYCTVLNVLVWVWDRVNRGNVLKNVVIFILLYQDFETERKVNFGVPFFVGFFLTALKHQSVVTLYVSTAALLMPSPFLAPAPHV